MRKSGARWLRELRQSLHPGKPLDDVQWLELISILDLLAEGYDARSRFGITPKTGAPPTARGMHKWIVLHVLALCVDDPGQPQKVQIGTVALAWDVPDNQVRKLLDKYRAELQPLVATMGVNAILESVPILQPAYKQTKKAP